MVRSIFVVALRDSPAKHLARCQSPSYSFLAPLVRHGQHWKYGFRDHRQDNRGLEQHRAVPSQRMVADRVRWQYDLSRRSPFNKVHVKEGMRHFKPYTGLWTISRLTRDRFVEELMLICLLFCFLCVSVSNSCPTSCAGWSRSL